MDVICVSLLFVHFMRARQFVENHFVDMTVGRIRLLVGAIFRRVRKLRHSVEIVSSTIFIEKK